MPFQYNQNGSKNNMTKIPQISKALQKEHTGETAAIVEGKIVAFGRDSLEAEKKAVQKGFRQEDVMTAFIMGNRAYAI